MDANRTAAIEKELDMLRGSAAALSTTEQELSSAGLTERGFAFVFGRVQAIRAVTKGTDVRVTGFNITIGNQVSFDVCFAFDGRD